MAEQTSISQIGTQLGGQLLNLGRWGIYLGLLLAVLGVIGLWAWNRNKWNLKVEFKLPRSNGTALYSEHGKGFYKASKGYCVIKRAGFNGAKYKIKNFDPKIFLQGKDTLTVIQIGGDEFIPVVPDSFFTVVNENGTEGSILKLKADLGKNNAWASQRIRDSLSTYTIQSLLKDALPFIGIALIIVTIIISQYIGTGFLVDKVKAAILPLALVYLKNKNH